ncbi:hypothetical protein HK103_005475 [Boothiomyces macroporosus]|uniref:Uncharacterized protein n=1 Tax=Boothiomyces macroporosus TaxID=261099 RepID=A0AAD5Y7T6_9FUNG|nr:hypothetical protein HK103_005475 [Boothiomyces macroporosus]KAJ3310066.1 hypothetical protein HDV04_005409 [Boothiomyces sp. JEL0838]
MKLTILTAIALVSATPMPQADPQNCNQLCHKRFPFGNQLGRLIQCQNVCKACAQHCVKEFPFGNQLGEQNQCIAQCTPDFVLPTTAAAQPTTQAAPPAPTATVFANCDAKCAAKFPFGNELGQRNQCVTQCQQCQTNCNNQFKFGNQLGNLINCYRTVCQVQPPF